jgi:hypothetical protein
MAAVSPCETAPPSTQQNFAMQSFTRTAALIGLVGGLLGQAHATIVSGSVTTGTGSFIKLTVPFTASTPDNTVGNDNFQNNNLYGFDEGQNIVISTALQVDDLANGLGGGTGAGTLAKNTVVASHYVFFDPKNTTSQKGQVTFDSNILAVISSTNKLAASDFLIQTGVNYLNPTARGLEAGDFVTITGLKQISVNWTASTPGDYVRVLTAFSPSAPVPEPSEMTLTLSGLICLGFFLRRRSSTRG